MQELPNFHTKICFPFIVEKQTNKCRFMNFIYQFLNRASIRVGMLRHNGNVLRKPIPSIAGNIIKTKIDFIFTNLCKVNKTK